MSIARYTTGTCQINGAGAVVGSGTLWASAVTPGDWFSLTVAGPFYEVLTVTDDTHITVDPAPSTTGSGQSYVVSEMSPLRGSIAQNNILLTAFRTQLGSILTVSGADKTITLNKTGTSDNAGLILQQGGTSLFQEGIFGNGSANTRWQVQYLVSATWTPGISVDPTSGKVGFGVAAATQILDAVASSAALALWDNASAATGKGGALLLQASNASSARTTFASLSAYVTTTTAAAEVGDLVVKTMRAGTLTEAARFLGAGNLLSNISGTAGAPAYSFVGDPDTGLYRIGANEIGIACNGTTIIDVVTAGVGITGLLSVLGPIGAGGVIATVMLASIGTTTNSSAYALFCRDSSLTDLFYIRNDGLIAAPKTSGLFIISSTVASTSTSTGALTVAGGVGIAGSLYVGVNAIANTVESNFYAGIGSTNLYGNTTHSWVNAINTVQMALLSTSGFTLSAGTMTLSALANGTLTSVSGVITSSSDETLKTIKGPFARSISDLLKMDRPILYNWNEKSGLDQRDTFAGWTAQGVRKGIPEAVSVGPDGKLSLSDRTILAAAVNGLIDHERHIAALTRQIAGAQDRIAALESRIH